MKLFAEVVEFVSAGSTCHPQVTPPSVVRAIASSVTTHPVVGLVIQAF